ncbi:MAG: N-6 DNA methylase [Candidatus Brocadiaceae bacterium]|nr:N-6 DNA methylase [Candidatus Brocadiaceae bacterium]
MAIPQEILGLVGRFDNNLDAYRSGTYNETQLRREFVDPFFKLLGWDVNNEKGYDEAYKDVIHEDSIKVGGFTKAPDYCFRIGGTRKFFVETKKPSVNLKDDISPAFQLRRYAWSAKLPLSILTDFEAFAVYDCRVKPDKSDKSSTARILYLTYTEYAQRWDEISQIFLRDAVLKGSFDRYAESSKVKKGTASVDDAFLKEIESWRDTIARNLALRNPDLTQYDLNFTVQRTIDRIVFLRICEDRGIEKYGRLMALQNGDRVYARLCEMFHRADERYNSGLFHFQKDKSRAESPDTLTLNVTVDDSVLKNIIKNLYYPDSPYEFSVISPNILGQVYEQFLGKVIRLTAGHRTVVEEKPEGRKAGGVYYTPTYIVDYIVKNTVGKLLECGLQNDERIKIPLSKGGAGVVNPQNPKSVSKLKILDPACGSGSFLLGAYTYLLDWHRDWYVADGLEKWANPIYA